ncbi:3151_t:CDS:10, partial [Funneliformis caledonium]
MKTKSLAEEIKSWGLYHAIYWSSDLNSWGSLCDWDLYFIDKNPECTKEQAHQSLSLELDILLKNMPNRSLQYSNAKALKKTLKNSDKDSANNLIWNEHLTKLTALAVSDRVHKRKIESITIQEEIGRAEEQMSKRHQREHTPEDKIKTINVDEVPSATTTSLYAPSSPPSPVDEEYIMVKDRSYCLDYLTGPGVPEWQLDEGSTRWIVNNTDITEVCREYRTILIKKCESMEVTLSATEELALSHVFVFQEENPFGLCEYFEDKLWEELFSEFHRLYPYPSIPNKISDLFVNIVKIACENPNHVERQKLARRCLRDFEATIEDDEIIVEMFRELIDNEQTSFTRRYTVEDTHTIKNITPIVLRPFFKNNRKITFEGANKMSESPASAKRRFDPVLLVSEDLISLGKTMKSAIDKSIKDGADDLVICGMQIIGFLGRAYVMDLRFEGVYRMILIGEFELPRGSTSWGTVLQCYQVLSIIRAIVNDGATSYQTAIRMKNQSKSKMMIKPMFHSPIKQQVKVYFDKIVSNSQIVALIVNMNKVAYVT